MSVLNYKVIGSGEPIVLIHGLFGSLENLNMVAKPLSEQYQVISVDVRNHGSSFHSADMNYELMADDVIAVLNELNIDNAYFLGHSMGGKVAMTIAMNHPHKVNKLIVADIAPVNYEPSHLNIIKGLKSIDLNATTKRSEADRVLTKYVKELSTRQFLLKNLAFSEDTAFWRCDLDAISSNYEKLLSGIQTDKLFEKDTMFVKGGNSNYIGMEHKALINHLFPKAKAKIIQGTGHWLHAEKPAAFNKIVLDFLNS